MDEADEHSDVDKDELIEELRIHQAELAIQNDELRQLAEELRHTRDEYMALYHHNPVGLLTLQAGNVVAQVNQSLLAMLGATRDELLGSPFTALVPAAHQEAAYLHLRAAANDGASQHEVEISLWHNDGHKVPVRLISQGMNGSVRVTVTDLSRLRQSEKKNEQRMTFLAMISHELRNPLNIIRTTAETLNTLPDVWESEMRAELLTFVENEVDALNTLIGQLLDASRMEMGIFRVRQKPVALHTLMTDLRPRLEYLCSQHPLTITLPDDDLTLHIDERRIQQVVLNIVQNATKYTPPGTPVSIEVAAAAPMVEFAIADDGPGIPADQQDSVFDLFQQAGHAPSLDHDGVGLGLAICRGVVEAHNGRLWLEEGSQSAGATFVFTLPTPS
jgi:PAS domain S-box-containing protein